ncbi:hypothetical protein QQ045_033305 [Rhodiola kirilowii]
MNKLHHQPADTPSRCFSALLHCLLCGGTVATRSSSSSPTPQSTSVSTKFCDLLQNDDPVRNLSDQQAPQVPSQVPIVARLMGLETPVDMSWVPRMVNVDVSFNRSRSVNSVDCLLHFDPKPNLLHRRAKTSLSFREVPVGDFLVVSLENSKCNATSDKKRAKYLQKAKTEGGKDEGRTARVGRGASDTTKNKRQLGQIRLTTTRIQSSYQIVTNVELSDHQRKMGTSCQRTGKENNRGTVRNARSAWQQRNYYYDKPQPVKSHSRSKALSKLKSKLPKDVNPSKQFCLENSISSGATQSRRRKARLAEVRVSPRPQTEEKRRSRTRKIEDEGAETYGEVMMNKIKWVVTQDLEGKRWNWRNEAGFLHRDYLSLEIELWILDELLNQVVRDLAS